MTHAVWAVSFYAKFYGVAFLAILSALMSSAPVFDVSRELKASAAEKARRMRRRRGLVGFGTAAASAKKLGLKEDNKALHDATKEIYSGDEYMTKLAETGVNLQAEAA